jgi:WD40 repeat protein
MINRSRIHLIIAGFLLIMSLTGIVTAAGLVKSWEERSPLDNPFSGVVISKDNSTVYAGGSQIFVRSWEGEKKWLGWSGILASMSADENYFISGLGDRIQLDDKNGNGVRIVSTDAQVRAVALSSDGSIMIGADDSGNIYSWRANNNKRYSIHTDLVRQMAYSPSDSFIVVTTEAGLAYYTPYMDEIFVDNKSGSLESFIEISSDSSTVITSGETRVSSHTNRGVLNWRKDVTQNAIIDMACSDDCSTIVLGSQDQNVLVLDQYGEIQWKYPTGSWVNGVGVSGDGSIIAATTQDRNLYVLDKEGRLIAKTTTDTALQPLTVAVSGDGKHIVIADQVALYGFELIGVPEVSPGEILNPAPVVTATSSTQVPLNTTLPKTLPPVTMKTVPEKTGTYSSSLNPYLAIAALSGLLVLVLRKNK